MCENLVETFQSKDGLFRQGETNGLKEEKCRSNSKKYPSKKQKEVFSGREDPDRAGRITGGKDHR